MKEASRRQKRVADLFRKEVSEIIQNEIGDPRLGFVTVTSVNLSPDLRNARIYVQVLGDEKKQRSSLIALKSATSFIRTAIASRVSLRYIPSLHFQYDSGQDHFEHITNILKEIDHGSE